jgi:putative phosphoesterase
MKIAVMSDSHDHIRRLDLALVLMVEADRIIHCGDLCSPFMVKHIGEAARGRPVDIVWGNNDGDPRLICDVAGSYRNICLHGQFAEIEIDGLTIAVNHYPEIAGPLAASGRFDLVCYGHDHTAHESRVGECTLLNPGELMGMKGPSTFAWFDTVSRAVRFEDVD